MQNITREDIKSAVRYRLYKVSALNYLAVTSAVVTYPFGKDAISSVFPSVAPYLAILVSILIYRFVDGPLSNGLDYLEGTAGDNAKKVSWRHVFRSTAAQKRRMMTFVVVFVAAVGTGGMSFVANYLIADNAAPMPDTEILQQGQQQNNKDRQQRLTLLATDIQQATTAIQQAKKEGHAAVESAYCAYNPRWCERPKAHINYALTLKNRGDLDGSFKVWYNGVVSAQQDSANTVEAAKQQLTTLQNNKGKLLADTETNAGLTAAFRDQQNRADMVFSKFTSFLILTDIFAVFFALACAYWLAQFKSDGGRLPESANLFQERFDEWIGQQKDSLLFRLFGEQQQTPTTDNKNNNHSAPGQHAPTNPTTNNNNKQQLAPNIIPVSNNAATTDYTTMRRLQQLEAKAERVEALEAAVRVEREKNEQQAAAARAAERQHAEQQKRQQKQQQPAKPVANRVSNKQQQQPSVFQLTVQENDQGEPFVMYQGPKMSAPKPYYYKDAKKQYDVYSTRKQTPNNKKRADFFKSMMKEIEQQNPQQ